MPPTNSALNEYRKRINTSFCKGLTFNLQFVPNSGQIGNLCNPFYFYTTKYGLIKITIS